MAVRQFNGSDRLTCDEGTCDTYIAGAHSYVLVFKPSIATAIDTILATDASGGTPSFLYVDLGGSLWQGGDPGDVSMATGLTNTWQVAGISKAAGTVTPRGHRKVLGSGSWTHVNGSSTWSNSASTVTGLLFGERLGLTPNMLLAVFAIFTTELADATYENIESNASTKYLSSLGPIALWEFNQDAVATDVKDLTGNGADETADTGTAVITGDDPPWTFGAVGRQAGTPVTSAYVSEVTSRAQSVTVGAGDNRILVVCVTGDGDGGGGISVSGVTFGAAGLTKLDEASNATWGYSEIWYKIAPAVSTADVTVTVDTTDGFHFGVYVFTGVDQTTPFRTPAKSTGTGTSVSNTVTGTVAGDYLIDSLEVDNISHAVAVGADQAERWDLEGLSPSTGVSSTQVATGGVMSHSWTGSVPFSHVAAALIPANPAGLQPQIIYHTQGARW